QKAGAGRPGNPGSPSFTFPTPCCPITGYIPLTSVTEQLYSNLWVYFNEFPWLTDHAGPVIRAADAQSCEARANDVIAGNATESWTPPYPNAIFISVWNGSLGSQVWPGDGENGVPGGKPGNGGAGGVIASTIPLSP